MLNAPDRAEFRQGLSLLKGQVRDGIATPIDAARATATLDYLLTKIDAMEAAMTRGPRTVTAAPPIEP